MTSESIFGRVANPWLEDVKAYVPGPTLAEAAMLSGVSSDRWIKLSSNENPLGPPALAVQRAQARLAELHRYPDATARELRTRIADAEAISTASVIVGAGSSEIMSFIVRAFSRPGDEVLSMDPSFGVYSQIATAEGRIPRHIALQYPFELSIDQLISTLTPRTRIIFMTRPNNPTSRLISIDVLSRIAALAPDAVIVSDEAYIEFADDYRSQSAASIVLSAPNVLVTRTFSKAYGMANLRVGYALGRPESIAYLLRIKPTWNVGEVAQQAAIGALEDQAHFDRTIETVKSGRAFLANECQALGLDVVPQFQANFIMADIRSSHLAAAEFTERVGALGVMIRGDFHPDYVRISVGTPSDNERAIAAMGEVLTR